MHVDSVLVVVVLEALYATALSRVGPGRVAAGEPVASPGQVTAFTLGAGVLLVASTWPVHDLAEGYLLSVHMVQHLLLTLVAPPLLLMGTPAWLLRMILSPRWLRWTMRRVARPLLSLVLFNAVIVLSHWPLVVDLALRHHPVHLLVHVVLFVTASMMWWQVVSPLPEYPALSYPGRMLFLFLQSIVPTVPASFLTFGSSVIYPFYAEAPRIWGMSALTDQLVGGLIMKLVGGAILWLGIAVFFFRWWREEQAEGWDALKWRDVEHDIRTGLTRR
jgi:putative membrane protein